MVDMHSSIVCKKNTGITLLFIVVNKRGYGRTQIFLSTHKKNWLHLAIEGAGLVLDLCVSVILMKRLVSVYLNITKMNSEPPLPLGTL